MGEANITLKTNSDFKKQCDDLFSKFGISTACAINLFLHQAVIKQTIPFEIQLEKDLLMQIISKLPEAGKIDSKTGLYVLPKEWNNPEDDIYEKLV